MATDFLVCYPQDLIPLTSVAEIPSEDGRRLLSIRGSDFRFVDEVLINEVKATSVLISSQTRLIVTVPEAVEDQPITAVSVFSNEITLSGKSLVRFKLGLVTSKASGMIRLMQLFLKLLFTTPGRDIFDPELGGDVLKNLGHTFGKEQGAVVVSDFVISVDRTARQLIALQTKDNRVPREERLLTAKVESARFSKDQSALITTTSITNQAGKIGVANVVL